MLSKVVSKIPAWHDVNHQIQILTVLESIVHINEETKQGQLKSKIKYG